MAVLGSAYHAVARATCAYCKHVHYCRSCGNSTTDIASFIDVEPAAARYLVAYYDSWYPGFNGILHRAFVGRESKIRHALAESRQHMGCKPQQRRWLRRHATLIMVAAFATFLPMILSPSHPIAVYAYLADCYLPFQGPAGAPASDEELRAFLLSDSQLERYRTELKEDVSAVNTGKLFTIVRRYDGALEHRVVRTWNEFLPNRLPAFLVKRLDRKEISFLGDVVEAYLSSARIEAMGHYHSYGGPPSRGDQLAGRITKRPEIVVSNGIYPMVYVKGKIVDFGPVCADDEILMLVARLDERLQSGVETEDGISRDATDTTYSFLSYLQEKRGVDIDSLDDIRGAIVEMCADFEFDYKGLFARDMVEYEREDLDIYQLIHSVDVLNDWATYGLLREGWTVADFANANDTEGKPVSLE